MNRATLSQEVWQHSARIIESILEHPFNQELMSGTLARDKFAYYIEQDSLYLQDFARCHAILSSKTPQADTRKFLAYAEGCYIAEEEVVHEFFRKTYQFTETGKISPASINYTSYLLRTCSMESYEVGLAAVLPCFWVYREVGLNIAKNTVKNNPFSRWIDNYASPEFSTCVDEAIALFDLYADNSSQQTRNKMLQAFYNSCVYEWHFWNDAYHLSVFDSCENEFSILG